MIIIYLVEAPIGEILKIFMLVQVALSPGRDLDTFILVEAYLIAIVDLVICISMIVVGVLLRKKFNIGLKNITSRKVTPISTPIIR